MPRASALSAGITLILVILACALVGIFGLGAIIGSRVIGGLVGGVAGVVAGFVVVYRTYLVPLRTESMQRDYSHLTPQVDDED